MHLGGGERPVAAQRTDRPIDHERIAEPTTISDIPIEGRLFIFIATNKTIVTTKRPINFREESYSIPYLYQVPCRMNAPLQRRSLGRGRQGGGTDASKVKSDDASRRLTTPPAVAISKSAYKA